MDEVFMKLLNCEMPIRFKSIGSIGREVYVPLYRDVSNMIGLIYTEVRKLTFNA